MQKSPLLIIFLVVFIDLVGFGIVIPIMPYYARAFGASATALGWLMTSYSAMQFLFAPLWGRLSDRIGRRPVILVSLAGTITALCMLGLAHSLAWLFAARLFAGICGANISTASAYIADITAPEDRAKGMGIIGASFGLGFIFGPAIGGVLSKFGFATPMFTAAGLAFLNLLFALVRLPEPLASSAIRAENRPKRFDGDAFRDSVLGDPRTLAAVIVFFIATFAFTQVEVSFALFMLFKFGYGPEQAGWLLALMGLLGAVIQGGLIGKLSRRFSELHLILCGTVLMAIGLTGMSLALHLTGVIAAITVVAIGNGLNNPSLSSLASKGAPHHRRGATMGIYQSAGSLARVLGPLAGGIVFDRLGASTPFMVAAALYGLAFLTTAGFSRVPALKNAS